MKKKKKSTGKVVTIVLGSVIGFLSVFTLSCYIILRVLIDKRNYVPINEDFTILNETPSFFEDVINPSSKEPGTDSDLSEVESYMSQVESNAGELEQEEEVEIMNILLVGSDIREHDDVGRSDTMILVSINKETKQVVATSFLRDTFVKIPIKNEFMKLNAAYAYGGIELLFETLKYNYGVNVDKYIAVDFLSFIDSIEIIGGIDIQVYEEELYWFNQYIHASNLLVEPPEREHSDYVDFADGSYQHLNGKQALAYARFRYVGNGDFTRTDRQRRVVQSIFDKLKEMDVSTLVALLNQVIPHITTNLTDDECMEYLFMLPELTKYQIVSWHIPDEDFKYMTVNGEEVVAIDFSYYMKKLFNYMYTRVEMDNQSTTAGTTSESISEEPEGETQVQH